MFLYFSDVQGTDETDIPFFKKCVQKYYALAPPETSTDAEKKEFKIPQFEEYLRKKEDPTKFNLFEVCHVYSAYEAIWYIARRNIVYFLREKLYYHGLLSCYSCWK